MKLLPQSLVGRTVLVLLIGITVSHLISLSIYSGDRRSALTAVGSQQFAERIAATTRFLENLPQNQRPRAARSFWGPAFRVLWTPSSVLPADGGGWRAGLLRSALESFFEDLPPTGLRIRYGHVESPAGRPSPRRGDDDDDDRDEKDDDHDETPWEEAQEHTREMMGRLHGRGAWGGNRGGKRGGMRLHMGGPAWQAPPWEAFYGDEVVQVSLALTDGSWLNFAAPAGRLRPFLWSRVSLSIILMTVAVVVLSVWATRRATRPLAQFADAADRLGLDVNAPPVDESGPREVHHVARAFNTMQKRIQTFVRDRTQMLAALSHDLRTPITRLRLRAEFIEDAALQKKMLDDLEQMEAMITSTLAFSRDDAGDEPRKPFDLAVLLQGLCDDAADTGQNVTFNGPARLTYSGRPIAMKRVFANLIDNAVGYGGCARVGLESNDGQINVTVTDDGPGIPDDQLDQVFAPFHRVEQSRSRETGGVGLGLAVVRSIVRAHGGEVTLANRDEGGLLATVTLPQD